MSEDDAIAGLAVGLNEDAKAARKRGKAKDETPPTINDADLADAVGSLGDSIATNEPETEDRTDFTEAAHDAAIGRANTLADDAVVKDRDLIGFTRGFILDQIKARPHGWHKTSEGEQRDVIAACDYAAQELVRKIAEAIAADGKSSVRMLLTKVTLGDDIVIAGKAKPVDADEENDFVRILHNARGHNVTLTVASADDYRGNSSDEPDPDQPGFTLDDRGDDG